MKRKLCHPLITCLCITNRRPRMVLKAIINFENQDYPNKELIVSYPEDDLESTELLNKIQTFTEENIITISRAEELSLGAARNEAVSHSNGQYICLWDDDDCYHPMRVKYQFNNMQINGQYRDACMITNIILYDTDSDKSYIAFSNHWNGTLLCKTEHLRSVPFLDSNIYEANNLIENLTNRKLLHRIADFPGLYTYINHGQNALLNQQSHKILENSQLLNQETSDWVSANVNQQFEII